MDCTESVLIKMELLDFFQYALQNKIRQNFKPLADGHNMLVIRWFYALLLNTTQ
jgi:hypothetical protein